MLFYIQEYPRSTLNNRLYGSTIALYHPFKLDQLFNDIGNNDLPMLYRCRNRIENLIILLIFYLFFFFVLINNCNKHGVIIKLINTHKLHYALHAYITLL